MRLPRYTTLQLLMVATLIALILGLVTASRQSAGVIQRFRFTFSADGTRLVMQHEKGPAQVWKIDIDPPQLVEQKHGNRRLTQIEQTAVNHLDAHEISSFLSKTSHRGTGECSYTFYDIHAQSRVFYIVLFVVGFCGWSATWGIVTKRARSADQYRSHGAAPLAIQLCWGLMIIGGTVAVGIPIVTMFLLGPLLFPTFYCGLLVGLVAIARGAGRDTQKLHHTAAVQVLNLVALDPTNIVFAAMELALLRTTRVRNYLRAVNSQMP